MFEFTISSISAALLGAALVMALTACLYGLGPMRRVGRRLQKPSDEPSVAEEPSASLPYVTVIAYASSTEKELDEFLDAVLAQDYPKFDLVVVYDAGAESTAVVADKYAGVDNLYITFIPPGSQNLSRRKLALTLGMKAAKGEVVVTTASNALIPGDRWLRALAAPFADSTVDVVLGYSRMLRDELPAGKRFYREFDSVMTASQWIGYALSGRPYRGDGNNLALRRRIFFDHKGYARTINLHNGDDDLFVNEIADRANTRVAISGESILSMTWGEYASKMWTYRKESYDFTSKWLPRAPFLKAGLTSFLQWGVLLACAGAGVLSLPSLVTAIAAFLLLSLFFTLEILIYRRAASRLLATRLWISFPIFMLWHPVGNFLFRLRHRSDRVKNFTWQRKR